MSTSRPLDLPPHPSSPGAARRYVRARLAEEGLLELSETAELLVTELVTNGLLHTGSPMRIEVLRGADRIRVAVHDRSAVRGVRRVSSPEATTGRGLLLVDALARGWGSEVSDWGKVTWFDLVITAGFAAAES